MSMNNEMIFTVVNLFANISALLYLKKKTHTQEKNFQSTAQGPCIYVGQSDKFLANEN